MSNQHHRRLHGRQGPAEAWNDFQKDFKDVANDINPFEQNTTPNLEARAPAPSTIWVTQLTTLQPTFQGAVGGYTTMVDENDEPTKTKAVSALADATTLPKHRTTMGVGAPPRFDAPSSTPLPESLVPTAASDIGDHTTLAIASPVPTNGQDGQAGGKGASASQDFAGTLGSATAAPSSSSAADASNGETSGAAKAGIAIGVLAGLLLVALAVFFLFNKRKRQMEQERRAAGDEKVNGPMAARSLPAAGGASGASGAAGVAGAAGAAGAVGAVGAAGLKRQDSMRSNHSVQTPATAPQVNLRPNSQFNPTFGERRSSKGAALALSMMAAPSASSPRTPGQSPWERPMDKDHEDPFGDDAARPDTSHGEKSAALEQPNNPFEAPENVVGVAQTTDKPPKSPHIGEAAAAAAGAAMANAAIGNAITRKQSLRKQAPAKLDLTKAEEFPDVPAQPSPAGTEFSMTSVAPGQTPGPSQSANAIAAAGGPAQSFVHRVQLDFNPTLEDEIELKAGQLVRLLHEYDDGWALCIKLDRSQQGVAPRTCLSTRPVKPRPANGPPGSRPGPPINPNRGPGGPPRGPFSPAGRPMTPQGPGFPRPGMGPGGRPQSPGMRPQSPGMRPQSPAMQRPQSPATSRPQSPAGPMSPVGSQRPYRGSGADTRRMSPPAGPSPLHQQQPSGPPPGPLPQGPPQGPIGRKPVPGQAY